MSSDLTKGELSSERQGVILELLRQIQEKMPFLLELQGEERRSLPKMDDKSRDLIEQGLLLATQSPEILPGGFDLDEYRRAIIFAEQLEPVLLGVRQLMNRLEDCYATVGSEALMHSLVVFQAAKLAGKDVGLGQRLNGLGKRLVRK